MDTQVDGYGGLMAESLDLDAMLQRFRDRAAAVRQRPLPPVAGAERQQFIAQAQTDFQDFAIIGDAEGSIDDGVLVLRSRSSSARCPGRGDAALTISVPASAGAASVEDHPWLPVAGVALAVVCWGLGGVAVKSIDASAVTIAFWRMWIAATDHGAVPLRDRRPSHRRRARRSLFGRSALRGADRPVLRGSAADERRQRAADQRDATRARASRRRDDVRRARAPATTSHGPPSRSPASQSCCISSSGQPEVSRWGDRARIRQPHPLDHLLPRGEARPPRRAWARSSTWRV